MQNCTGCLAWAWFSSSIWPSNFIKHLHSSSSGAPNPVLWDMANRFAAAGPGTTCHQPGAFVKRPQVDRRFTMEPEWQGDSDLVNHLERFHVSFLRCNPRHYGSSVITRQKKPLLQRIVGQIQALQVSAGLQSCWFGKLLGWLSDSSCTFWGPSKTRNWNYRRHQLTHIRNIQFMIIHVDSSYCPYIWHD